MTTRARLLALTVVLLWGCNFLAIRVGIDHFPPIFFAGLRFLVIATPVVLFVPRPKVELRWLLLYGLAFGFAQFGFLFWAMHAGLATGLASLVLQSSAPMTVVLGAVLLGERLGRTQIIGLLVAIAGMLLVAVAQGGSSVGLVPLLLGLLAGLSWAIANIATRKAKSTEPMKLMSWMCVIATAPLFAVSWIVEVPPPAGRHSGQLSPPTRDASHSQVSPTPPSRAPSSAPVSTSDSSAATRRALWLRCR